MGSGVISASSTPTTRVQILVTSARVPEAREAREASPERQAAWLAQQVLKAQRRHRKAAPSGQTVEVGGTAPLLFSPPKPWEAGIPQPHGTRAAPGEPREAAVTFTVSISEASVFVPSSSRSGLTGPLTRKRSRAARKLQNLPPALLQVFGRPAFKLLHDRRGQHLAGHRHDRAAPNNVSNAAIYCSTLRSSSQHWKQLRHSICRRERGFMHHVFSIFR